MVWQTQSENSSVAIRAVIKQLQALDCFRNTNCVVCIEHAGLYNAHALEVLFQANSRFGWRLPYTLNKRVDYNEANPIALMLNVLLNMLMAPATRRFRDRLRLWQPPRPVMKKLAELTRLRQRLQGMINQLKIPLVEQKRFGDKGLTTQLGQYCSSSLKALVNDLKGVEKAIKQLTTDDTILKSLFDLVTSIPGVGQVVATELILASDEFKAIDDPKN